jgi:glycerate 2-kinase
MPHPFLLAFDSFKETFSAPAVCTLCSSTLQQQYPQIPVVNHPLSDGGDGFLACITTYLPGHTYHFPCRNAHNQPITAPVFFPNHMDIAIIESAQILGLATIAPPHRNPLVTTSRGLGLVMKQLAQAGYINQLICLGGSATNDLGKDMLTELGYQFIDAKGKPVQTGGIGLSHVNHIVAPHQPSKIKLTVLSDVSHPLLGIHGATRTFGPQKGADSTMLDLLEQGMQRVAYWIRTNWSLNLDTVPGAGAAGGIGAALIGLLNGTYQAGSSWLMHVSGFYKHLEGARAVITGEGCLDESSFQGKVVGTVVEQALQYEIPVYAVVGQTKLSEGDWKSKGIKQVEACYNPGILPASQNEARHAFVRAVEKLQLGS